jgi:protein phosphatase
VTVERIALISDIHANVPALQAVFDDIAARGIDRVICLGDLVGKGPQSDVAVDLCRDRCETVVRGNWDDFIGDPARSDAQRWHQDQLGAERLHYVANLPLSVDLMISGQNVRLFHASQTSVHVRVLMSAEQSVHEAMFDNTELTGFDSVPDVVGYGDIHRAYQMGYGNRLLFNAGSVGNPLGTTKACYAVLEGHVGDAADGPFGLHLLQVPYDAEQTLTIAKHMEMPHFDALAQELRTGVYAGSLRLD